MKRGATEHPKLLDLCSRLGLHKYEAVGILETLWHFTAKFAPQGDIGKYSDAAIAKAVGWQRPTGTKGVTPECRLSDALVSAGWLDRHPLYRLIVHDWEDHADQTLRRFLASRKLAFASAELADARLPLPIPLPIPEPLPPTPTAPVGAGDKGRIPSLKSWFDEQHEFWYKAYWNHNGKAESRKAYEKRVKVLVAESEMEVEPAATFLRDQAISYRERFENTESWSWRSNYKPATWLNQALWTDEAPQSSPAGKEQKSTVMTPELWDKWMEPAVK
jgi:hypothetical protein